MKKIFFILFLSFICSPLLAQRSELKLQRKINELVRGFNGEIGLYVKSLKNGKVVQINADSLFPTASIVKVPILIGIMDKIEKKELDYHQQLTWNNQIKYDTGEDILPYLHAGTNIELSKAIMLMMTISDNNASLWLQEMAGSGLAINSLMDSLGYRNTKVNSRTAGRELFREVYGWGQTTPREIATIFENIAAGKVLSEKASNKMLRIMGRQYWDEEALSAIPPDVFVASKNGAVNASRTEVLYVNGKHPYIISIFTKNNKDVSWKYDNEAWELTRKLSGLVWNYFNL